MLGEYFPITFITRFKQKYAFNDSRSCSSNHDMSVNVLGYFYVILIRNLIILGVPHLIIISQ